MGRYSPKPLAVLFQELKPRSESLIAGDDGARRPRRYPKRSANQKRLTAVGLFMGIATLQHSSPNFECPGLASNRR
jgi:hypothetical protein